MRWRGRKQSDNIEDRRGMRVGRGLVGGGIGTVVLALVAMYFGVDPSVVTQLAGGGGETVTEEPYTETAQEAEMREFVGVVLAETETAWSEQFAAMRGDYRRPTLVLFRDAVQSACGTAESAMGPFYCPPDERVFIDMTFFNDMATQLRAGGDFAYAYVIAHEVGHHVQNLLGISGRVQELRQRVSEVEANQLSVRLELQADCFAGLWGNSANKAGILEAGDVEEALGAAAAIGDDRLQRNAGRSVVPDSFTHGTSEQRVRWFRKGYETGDLRQGDTFAAREL